MRLAPVRAVPVGVALLLVAAAAAGAIAARQDVAVDPAALVTVTLAAGSAGTTTFGASATSAATAHTGPIALAQQVVRVHKVSGDWDVRMSVASATGFGALDTATVRETLGAVTLTQVVVAGGGLITQASGSPVTLTSSAADISVTVVGAKVSAGPSVLTMAFTLTPAGATAPVLTYSYTLTLTL